MSNFAFRDSAAGAIHDFTVDRTLFSASIHADIDCQQCHTDIKHYPHEFTGSRPKVGCGNDCHASDSTGAVYTHQTVVRQFETSAHKSAPTGKNTDTPQCTTCHGGKNPHAVRKARKSMTVEEKLELCASCHDDEVMMTRNKITPQAVSSYRRSFHFKAITFGEKNTAVCQDCHTVHHVLPADSVLSSISPANIASTCGQEQCHPGAKMNFAMSGANHLALRTGQEPVLALMESFFLVLTLGTMAMLVAGIILDVQKKFGWLTLAMTWLRSLGVAYSRGKDPLLRLLRFSKRILID
jgi:predicted CXXCH cytochrome family protein